MIFTGLSVWVDVFRANVLYHLHLEQDPWEHAALQRCAHSHSTHRLGSTCAVMGVRPSMWTWAEGQAHCNTSAFAVFIEREVVLLGQTVLVM